MEGWILRQYLGKTDILALAAHCSDTEGHFLCLLSGILWWHPLPHPESSLHSLSFEVCLLPLTREISDAAREIACIQNWGSICQSDHPKVWLPIIPSYFTVLGLG